MISPAVAVRMSGSFTLFRNWLRPLSRVLLCLTLHAADCTGNTRTQDSEEVNVSGMNVQTRGGGGGGGGGGKAAGEARG